MDDLKLVCFLLSCSLMSFVLVLSLPKRYWCRHAVVKVDVKVKVKVDLLQVKNLDMRIGVHSGSVLVMLHCHCSIFLTSGWLLIFMYFIFQCGVLGLRKWYKIISGYHFLSIKTVFINMLFTYICNLTSGVGT